MLKARVTAVILLIIGVLIGYFVYTSEVNKETSNFPFRYGLDLDGGTRLTYRADVSEVPEGDINDSLSALRQTIERRVNIFGVSEPIVQIEKGGIFSNEENANRLIVELPGVTEVTDAINAIGETPLLEFRLATEETAEKIIAVDIENGTPEEISQQIYDAYEATGLGGGDLRRSSVVFGHGQSGVNSPIVQLEFDSEGADLFEEITKNNIGNTLAIFLDGVPISTPVIQTEIYGGIATITGQFTAEEARELSRNLNFGALPLPIELIETQTIGASLGIDTLDKGIKSLIYAFIIIFIFLISYYKLPGLIASISLLIYVAIMFAVFKLIPVTLTASGVAGFILSLGMAVDANILIFERIKEELKSKKALKDSVIEGFKRAWLPIRDGNLSSIISAAVLFWLSGTSLVKGFALVFGIGVLVSMLTAVVVSRSLLLAFANEKAEGFLVKIFKPGFKK
jgi:protein-export membrane protein SecD